MLKMVHGSSGEHLLWPMVRYAQAGGNEEICRAIILAHLNEPIFNVDDLMKKYDGVVNDVRDVGLHCKTATQVLYHRQQQSDDTTLAQLVKEWRSKGAGSPQWYDGMLDFSTISIFTVSLTFIRSACSRAV